MKTIQEYTEDLKIIKNKITNYLNSKGISSDNEETLNTLIPKLETITSNETGVVSLSTYSFVMSPLTNEEIHDLLPRLKNVQFGEYSAYSDSYNISLLFYKATNLTHLNIAKDLNRTKIYSWERMLTGTSITNLSLKDITYSGSTGNNTSVTTDSINLLGFDKTKIVELDITNLTIKEKPSFSGYTNLENLIGLETLKLTNTKAPYMYNTFSNCSKLTGTIDLNWIPTGDPGTYALNANSCFSYCTNIENIIANFPEYYSSLNSFCVNCSSLKSLDLKLENNNKEIEISSLVNGCVMLENVDFSNIKGTSGTKCNAVLKNCKILKNANFDNLVLPDKVELDSFASGCTELESLTFSNKCVRPKKITYLLTGCKYVNELLDSLHFNEWDFSYLDGYQYDVITNPDVLYWDSEKIDDFFVIPKNLKNIDYLNFKNAHTNSTTGVWEWFPRMIWGFLVDTVDISNTHYKGIHGPITDIAVAADDTLNQYSARGLIKHLIMNDSIYELTYNSNVSDSKLFNKQLFLESVEADNLQIILENRTNIKGGLFGCLNLKFIDMSTWTIQWKDSTNTSAFYFNDLFRRTGLETFNFFGQKIKVSGLGGGFKESKYLHTVDISNADFSECTDMNTVFTNCPALVNITFGTDFGKGFDTSKGANTDAYSIAIAQSPLLTKDSAIDIFNKVYDLNIKYGSNLKTQYIDLHADVIAQLTPEEIAIATNKGWTVK